MAPYIQLWLDIPIFKGGLQVSNNNIVVREHSAIFSFDEEKLIGNFRSTSFLNVGINGLLIMTLKPDFRFKYSEKRAPNKTRQLLYDGDEVFELCTDQLIRHKSNCSGAKKVSILYIDFDYYRTTEPSDWIFLKQNHMLVFKRMQYYRSCGRTLRQCILLKGRKKVVDSDQMQEK